MSLKSKIKFFIDDQTISNIRANIKHIKLWKPFNRRVIILSNDVLNEVVIGKNGAHIFCGYFDIDPQNPNDSDQFLVHILPVGAKNGQDETGIGLVNIKTRKVTQIAETKAWCWQMGARLRWGRKTGNIFFNSYDEDGYCCKILDPNKGQVVQRIPDALYDISDDEKFGLTVDFERLQRLRPGYGYCCSNKTDQLKPAPEDDGLFIVDLVTGQKRLLVSLKKLSELYPEPSAGHNYINHVSISPDGNNAIFFHIWTCKERPGWKANLCNINIETGEVKYLEKRDQVSHYDWKNNREVLITAVNKTTGMCDYRIYNLDTGRKEILPCDHLCQDGHPVYSSHFSGFYSDTYPDEKGFQTLFKYSDAIGYEPLASFYADPRMYGEKRCDLHPHYFKNTESVAVDSTFSGRRRQVCVFKLSKNGGAH